MVMILKDHEAETPAGRLLGVPMPVAPVVVWVMVVSGVLIHSVGVDDAALTVLFVFVTVAVLLALIPLVQSGLTPLPDPDPRLLTVTVVLPLFTIPDAVNVPLPAVLTVMVAVLLLAELSPLRL